MKKPPNFVLIFSTKIQKDFFCLIPMKTDVILELIISSVFPVKYKFIRCYNVTSVEFSTLLYTLNISSVMLAKPCEEYDNCVNTSPSIKYINRHQ